MNLHQGEQSESALVDREPALGDGVPDAALDAVAAILRALGETATSGAEAADQLEAWARHILVLAAPPGSLGAGSSERDWPGLGRHVVNHVHDDSEAASRSIGDLRDAVWLVLERLSQSIVGDAVSDASATSQLDRLRAAISSPAEELKATALETVQELSKILDQKHERQLALARELGERVNVLNEELEDTRREADLDPLTRVCNRGVFQRELPRAMQMCTLLEEPACLVLVDIDEFKQINDQHGHKSGDGALELLASALVRCFPRRADVVARLGGDEFAVIAPSTSALDGYRLATRLLDSLRTVGGSDIVNFTVSAGLAEALPAEDPDTWFARADRALYEAKAEGRDRVFIAAKEGQAEDLAVS
jgi:diguanylate cyclase (GGDEF)-like protein